jgi:hypothetical protein
VVLEVHVVVSEMEALLQFALQTIVEYFLCFSADLMIAGMVELEMVSAEILLTVVDAMTVMLTLVENAEMTETAVMIENVDEPETLVSSESAQMSEAIVMIENVELPEILAKTENVEISEAVAMTENSEIMVKPENVGISGTLVIMGYVDLFVILSMTVNIGMP